MNSKKLYEHAMKDFGLSEVTGSKSNPRIQKAIARAADWLDSDDSKTAWCGCMMGLWCKELGLPVPKEYFRAASWRNVGKEVLLDDAIPGDIIVMSRTGGNHVTLFSKVKDGLVYCLGGNQRDAVNISSFSVKLVDNIRRL
jgi:uncharacterized protein (TIGR02594 family)